MGEYRRVEGVTSNTRPVWRKGATDRYFFYTSQGRWMIGTDYNGVSGWICSEDTGLTDIPCTRWQYTDGKKFHSNPKLTVIPLTK